MKNVSARLYYGAEANSGSKNTDWIIDGISQAPELIYTFRNIAVGKTITDLRDQPFQAQLDKNGFEMLTAPTQIDQNALSKREHNSMQAYQEETLQLLKAHTGADTVVIFDANLRDASRQNPPVNSPHAAHLRVHVDQNPTSALARAKRHYRLEHDFTRFQIINVWRPLKGCVRNYPIAMCDYQSLNLSTDLVPTQLKFPSWLKDSENYSLKDNPRHRWYYWESMRPHEVLLFKCYDSACYDLAMHSQVIFNNHFKDVAGLCPHSAFFNSQGPRHGHLRTSLELRTLLFYR